ncbi:Uncharacterised protein [Mycolicibacterium gilvum]|uniref:Transmembrane protein n=2 Tax=Mycolicibacterium gilvum TaxID=1804 RepID=A0A378SKF2_9MYCO|nr:hypothetical protein [Mycolicibacterium gilvum]STZ43292.1 Uncharacterised protein [Mycolicibacterium gilvum]
MRMRLLIGGLGIVALLVGIVGLIAPVSVSAEGKVVGCGSVIAPDLSAARANDDAGAANTPVPGGLVNDANFTRLCDMDLEDRRLWTITSGALGALIIAAAVAHGITSRRAGSTR